MQQTKLESFLEANVNTAIGFIVSLTFWHFVIVPVWHLPVHFADNLIITGLFTAISVARGYVVRRWFNAEIHKLIHKVVRSRLWNN
jgi:hypothetical protein